MTAGRRRRIDQIPEKKAAVVGVNIRTLRQRKGWTQAELGELMGGQTPRPYAPPKATATDGSAVSPPGKSGSWPPSSASPPGSSQHGARTATAAHRTDSHAWHAEPRRRSALIEIVTAGRDRDVAELSSS